MLKPVLGLAAAGFIGVALLKILSVLLLPLVGTVLGMILTVLKIAFVVAIVFFVIWLFRRKPGEEKAAD